jgi:hypothetical protein
VIVLVQEELFNDVKGYLDITWTMDEPATKKLKGIIERGMKYLDNAAGKTLNYTVEDKPKELLLDYCRYVRSNALSEFQNNYLPELLTLQIMTEVAEYEAQNTNTDV